MKISEMMADLTRVLEIYGDLAIEGVHSVEVGQVRYQPIDPVRAVSPRWQDPTVRFLGAPRDPE